MKWFFFGLFFVGIGGANFAVYTLWLPEQYPTECRGSAFAFATSVGRFVGAGFTFLVGAGVSHFHTIGIPVALTAIPFLLGLFLIPFGLETKGQPLPVSGDLFTPAPAANQNRRADANLRRAFFDGDFEIVAHSHRQHRQHAPEIRSLSASRKLAQLAEIRARICPASSKYGGTVISPSSSRCGSASTRLRERWQVFFRHAALRGLTAEMHLDQDL